VGTRATRLAAVTGAAIDAAERVCSRISSPSCRSTTDFEAAHAPDWQAGLSLGACKTNAALVAKAASEQTKQSESPRGRAPSGSEASARPPSVPASNDPQSSHFWQPIRTRARRAIGNFGAPFESSMGLGAMARSSLTTIMPAHLGRACANRAANIALHRVRARTCARTMRPQDTRSLVEQTSRSEISRVSIFTSRISACARESLPNDRGPSTLLTQAHLGGSCAAMNDVDSQEVA